MSEDAGPERRFSVARVTRAWYVACLSTELGQSPLSRTLFGTPIVLFRGNDGTPAALLDRCAHRNVPLSLGRVTGKGLECGYHGWRYDCSGACVGVPGLLEEKPRGGARVPAFAVREQDGFIWVWATPGAVPEVEPYRIADLGQGYTTVRRVVEAEAPLHAVLENALDVPHTAFLHRGLFRGTGQTKRIRARVTRTASGVQAEYLGEPRPQGLAGRILSPSGGVVTHFDRFILPSIAQVEYRLGTENHFLVTAFCTPSEDFRTRLHAVIAFRTRFPGWLLKLALTPVALRIFGQDARILKAQSDAVRRFGKEQFSSTEADVLGLQIWQLLSRAEKGELPAFDPEWSRELELEV